MHFMKDEKIYHADSAAVLKIFAITLSTLREDVSTH